MPLRPVAQPLHRQLRDLMLARIGTGEWSPGTYLPSETRLAEEYGVAVGTLRKALLDLASEGVVVRRQGKGTVVVSHESDAVQFRFLNLRGADGSTLRPESRIIRRERRAALPGETGALDLHDAADIVCITRVREADGTPILFEQIVLDAARFGALETDPELLPNTLYQLYQAQFGANVHRAREEITATAADTVRAAELGLAPGTPLLHIKRVAHDFNIVPIELRLSWVNTATLYYLAEV